MSTGGEVTVEQPRLVASQELARAAMIARRFYRQGATKQGIARDLGISRFKVARYLQLAHDRELVHITIDDPGGFDLELGSAMQERFGLGEAWVIDETVADDDSGRTRLGSRAAPIIAELVEPDDVMGLAWGRTLGAMVDHLPNLAARTVVQIVGDGPSGYGDSPADVVRRAAERFSVEPLLLHVPLFVGDAATATALRGDAVISSTLASFDRLDVTVVGVGAWADGASNVTSQLTAEDVTTLDGHGAVAETTGLFLDSEGEPVHETLRQRTIAISLEQLRDVPRRVAVAGGAGKVDALAAVLDARLLTQLVTDRSAAAALLDR